MLATLFAKFRISVDRKLIDRVRVGSVWTAWVVGAGAGLGSAQNPAEGVGGGGGRIGVVVGGGGRLGVGVGLDGVG